jgi:hypothetical protein
MFGVQLNVVFLQIPVDLSVTGHGLSLDMMVRD